MNTLFRIDGAQATDPAVAEWLDCRPTELGAMARHWFAQLRACGPDVRECVHDGCPVACVDDAPFGYVNVFTAHAAIGFFHGASLPDPSGVLEGNGRHMRHIKLRPSIRENAAAIDALILEAYRDIRERLANS